MTAATAAAASPGYIGALPDSPSSTSHTTSPTAEEQAAKQKIAQLERQAKLRDLALGRLSKTIEHADSSSSHKRNSPTSQSRSITDLADDSGENDTLKADAKCYLDANLKYVTLTHELQTLHREVEGKDEDEKNPVDQTLSDFRELPVRIKDGIQEVQNIRRLNLARATAHKNEMSSLKAQLAEKTRQVRNLTITLFSVIGAAVVAGVAIVAGDCLKRQAPDNCFQFPSLFSQE